MTNKKYNSKEKIITEIVIANTNMLYYEAATAAEVLYLCQDKRNEKIGNKHNI